MLWCPNANTCEHLSSDDREARQLAGAALRAYFALPLRGEPLKIPKCGIDDARVARAVSLFQQGARRGGARIFPSPRKSRGVPESLPARPRGGASGGDAVGAATPWLRGGAVAGVAEESRRRGRG